MVVNKQLPLSKLRGLDETSARSVSWKDRRNTHVQMLMPDVELVPQLISATHCWKVKPNLWVTSVGSIL